MTAFLLNPTVAVLFYGAVLALVISLCMLGESPALHRLALWSAAAWVGSNIIFAWLGERHTPWLSPAFNALICVGIAGVAIKYRSNVAWWLVSLYCVEFAFIAGSFLKHAQGTIAYYTILNMVFLGRMIILGDAGYVELAGRLRRGRVSPGYRVARVARDRHGPT